jgi:hydrogenase nickel incorporation protein HypA/HybF
MHELGIVHQIIKSVDDVVDEQGLFEVSKITLQIGEMSDIIPQYLIEAWKSFTPSTKYSNTKLDLEIIEAKAKCKQCNYTDSVKNINLTCPICNSMNFEIISGKEFLIKEIEAR